MSFAVAAVAERAQKWTTPVASVPKVLELVDLAGGLAELVGELEVAPQAESRSVAANAPASSGRIE
ncbi:MAG: hypothetical protein M0T80_14650 [Actinomycetota bacterium]|nr:hypothetical protein [Actinomycetota bacterium]